MTPFDRFNAWLKRTKPDQYGYTIQKVIEKAAELGYSEEEVRQACREIRHWLSINDDKPKANKRHWGKFILNWMRPRPRTGGRLAPSKFEGE